MGEVPVAPGRQVLAGGQLGGWLRFPVGQAEVERAGPGWMWLQEGGVGRSRDSLPVPCVGAGGACPVREQLGELAVQMWQGWSEGSCEGQG